MLPTLYVRSPLPFALLALVFCAVGMSEWTRLSGLKARSSVYLWTLVWVATAAGSTGAIRSAGGVVVDMREHWLQYWVREPFMGASAHRYRLLTGHLGPDGIRFRSQMIQGMVFLDGRRNGIPVGYGCDVALRPDAPPLRLFLHNGRGRMGTA